MHGNVCEWCADHSHNSYEGSPTDETAWLNQNNNGIYVLRGGSWRDNPENCRSARRHNNNNQEISKQAYYGFRVVYSGVERI
jgi:formylglycine-generating enzyme required for sulfatase activity